MYQVRLQKFEGPFELLIELIDKKKLSINEISLAEVADQYLDHLKEMKDFPLEEVAYFIVIGATLTLIKSRSLLPSLKLSKEEELEIVNLEEQLKLYKQFRSLAGKLEKIFAKKIIFNRESFAQIQPVFVKPREATLPKLRAVLKTMLNNLPKKQLLPEATVKKIISLEQKIEELISKLKEKMAVCFSDFKKPGCDKIDLIISFLALLELIKRGMVITEQEYTFGDIDIKKI